MHVTLIGSNEIYRPNSDLTGANTPRCVAEGSTSDATGAWRCAGARVADSKLVSEVKSRVEQGLKVLKLAQWEGGGSTSGGGVGARARFVL